LQRRATEPRRAIFSQYTVYTLYSIITGFIWKEYENIMENVLFKECYLMHVTRTHAGKTLPF
jgi:hypothetical protein